MWHFATLIFLFRFLSHIFCTILPPPPKKKKIKKNVKFMLVLFKLSLVKDCPS